MERLKGKVAIVTGATSGIGRAIAQRFAAEGADVVAAGRREERLKEFSHGIATDITKEDDCTRLVDESIRRLGRISLLVNAAGVIASDGILIADPGAFQRMLDVNLTGTYTLCRLTVPHLIREGGASILNISSVCGIRPFPSILSYCVSKSAVDMLTRCLALELAPQGVRVNSINPGVVRTELHTVTNAIPDYEAFMERSKTTHPLGRTGRPEEIASMAAYLASDEAAWVTGGLHSIDGGRNLTCLR